MILWSAELFATDHSRLVVVRLAALRQGEPRDVTVLFHLKTKNVWHLVMSICSDNLTSAQRAEGPY